MPRRTVLSAAQRATFETLPADRSEFTKYYLLSDEDLGLIGSRRRTQNRLGFAVQLCLVRYPGRVLRAAEKLPPALVAFVADQIGADPFALARAVVFNRLGEVRDRSFEGQSARASGLNLLVAAIVLWNTRYLEAAIEQVRREIEVPDDYLRYLSPLGWDHINLTGDYIWKLS